MARPTIFLTNDDGVEAAGLTCLREAMADLGDLFVVAPDRERSAIGHAITLDRAIHAHLLEDSPGCRVYACTGTPTDCVKVGILGLLKRDPELVISGINHGANMGEDLTYSGTVCAAMEGAIGGVPSIAASVLPDAESGESSYDAAARAVRGLGELVLQHGLPRGIILNVNAPSLPAERIKGLSVTRLGHRDYRVIVERQSNDGQPAGYWIRGKPADNPGQWGSDVEAVAADRVSITPVALDMTAAFHMDFFTEWPLDALSARLTETP